MIPWRHQYDEAVDTAIGNAAAQTFTEESLTQQHFTRDADLNTIVKRYGISDGAIPPAALDGRYYGDFSNVYEFRDILDHAREAMNKFNKLPADLRAQFNNDPAVLHDWVMDPVNAAEAVELGLLAKTPTPEPPPPKTDAAVDPQKAV